VAQRTGDAGAASRELPLHRAAPLRLQRHDGARRSSLRAPRGGENQRAAAARFSGRWTKERPPTASLFAVN
jgi:hypothetical protein